MEKVVVGFVTRCNVRGRAGIKTGPQASSEVNSIEASLAFA
jgi:hypothetical protein